MGLVFSPDGTTLYVSNEGDGGSGSSNRVFQFIIPEPATMGMLGLGFAGLAALRRRRK